MDFKVRFYVDQQGLQPAKVLLEDLRIKNPTLHKLLTASLVKLENGSWHGPPHTEQVDTKNGIFELRVGRKDIARAFFFFRRGQEIIVTNGYVKQAQKVDRDELKKAQKCKQDWEKRFP